MLVRRFRNLATRRQHQNASRIESYGWQLGRNRHVARRERLHLLHLSAASHRVEVGAGFEVPPTERSDPGLTPV
jgi:hypothetical protein